MSKHGNKPAVNKRELLADEISKSGGDVEDILRLAHEAFYRFRAEGALEAIRKAELLEPHTQRLTASLVRLSESSDEKERQLLQGHLSHLRYIQLIGNCAKDFAECVVEKIKEGLLFSDKAFGEIQNLFQEVEELLNNALVAYTRGDEDLAKKIVERGTAVERLIDNYSSEHEKRLISGVCTVRSSAIFLDMLDALRRISGHAVSMACSVGQLRKG